MTTTKIFEIDQFINSAYHSLPLDTSYKLRLNSFTPICFSYLFWELRYLLIGTLSNTFRNGEAHVWQISAVAMASHGDSKTLQFKVSMSNINHIYPLPDHLKIDKEIAKIA